MSSGVSGPRLDDVHRAARVPDAVGPLNRCRPNAGGAQQGCHQQHRSTQRPERPPEGPTATFAHAAL
jgi:hypothetical protein